MDLMQIRRMLMTIGGKPELWKQKQVTVQTAISLGGAFNDLISSNLPTGVTFCMIVKDDLDSSSFLNNQLVCGVYDTVHNKLNSIFRFRSNDYTSQAGTNGVWSDTYALTASVGDTYTLFFQ